MTLMRRAVQRDKNERAVVDALEGIGCIVARLSQEGIPDLLVFDPLRREIVLVEVKRRAKPTHSPRKLKGAQADFVGQWTAAGARVYVVTSAQEVIEKFSDRTMDR